MDVLDKKQCTLQEYLAAARKALSDSDGLKQLEKVHVIVGNEACDLDSAVCALVYGYHLWMTSERNQSSSLVLPVLNIPKEDYGLKTEVVFALEERSIGRSILCFSDEFDPLQWHTQGKLILTLVDHHLPVGKFAGLADAVVEVVDHHSVNQGQETGFLNKIKSAIEPVGSCATLIAEKMLAYNTTHTLSAVTALLLYETIVLDTCNFSQDAKKVTPKDHHVAEELRRLLPSAPPCEQIFKRLVEAKADVSKLTVEQILRKDMKILEVQHVKLAVCSIPQLARECFKTDQAMAEIEDFCRKSSYTGCVILGVSISGPKIHRDMLLFAPEVSYVDLYVGVQLLDDLCSSKYPPLDLKKDVSFHCPDARYRHFDQGNVAASRKQIMPLLTEILERKLASIRSTGLVQSPAKSLPNGNIEAVSAVSSHSARAPLHPINPSLPMFFPEKAAKRLGEDATTTNSQNGDDGNTRTMGDGPPNTRSLSVENHMLSLDEALELQDERKPRNNFKGQQNGPTDLAKKTWGPPSQAYGGIYDSGVDEVDGFPPSEHGSDEKQSVSRWEGASYPGTEAVVEGETMGSGPSITAPSARTIAPLTTIGLTNAASIKETCSTGTASAFSQPVSRIFMLGGSTDSHEETILDGIPSVQKLDTQPAHHSNSADGEITDNVLASRWISSPQQSANQYNDDSSRSISPNPVKNSKSPTCAPRPEYEYPWSTELEAKHKASEKEQSRPSTPLPGDMPPYFELKSPMNEQCKEKFQFAPRKKCGLDEADSGRGVKTDPDTGSTETAGAAGSKITADSASSVPNAVGKNGLAQSDQNPSNREGVSVPHTCTTTEKPAVTDDPTDMKRDTTQKDFILLSERAIGSSSPSTGASRERSVPRRPWDMPKLNIEAALGTATPGTSDGNGKNLSVLMPEERGIPASENFVPAGDTTTVLMLSNSSSGDVLDGGDLDKKQRVLVNESSTDVHLRGPAAHIGPTTDLTRTEVTISKNGPGNISNQSNSEFAIYAGLSPVEMPSGAIGEADQDQAIAKTATVPNQRTDYKSSADPWLERGAETDFAGTSAGSHYTEYGNAMASNFGNDDVSAVTSDEMYAQSSLNNNELVDPVKDLPNWPSPNSRPFHTPANVSLTGEGKVPTPNVFDYFNTRAPIASSPHAAAPGVDHVDGATPCTSPESLPPINQSAPMSVSTSMTCITLKWQETLSLFDNLAPDELDGSSLSVPGAPVDGHPKHSQNGGVVYRSHGEAVQGVGDLSTKVAETSADTTYMTKVNDLCDVGATGSEKREKALVTAEYSDAVLANGGTPLQNSRMTPIAHLDLVNTAEGVRGWSSGGKASIRDSPIPKGESKVAVQSATGGPWTSTAAPVVWKPANGMPTSGVDQTDGFYLCSNSVNPEFRLDAIAHSPSLPALTLAITYVPSVPGWAMLLTGDDQVDARDPSSTDSESLSEATSSSGQMKALVEDERESKVVSAEVVPSAREANKECGYGLTKDRVLPLRGNADSRMAEDSDFADSEKNAGSPSFSSVTQKNTWDPTVDRSRRSPDEDHTYTTTEAMVHDGNQESSLVAEKSLEEQKLELFYRVGGGDASCGIKDCGSGRDEVDTDAALKRTNSEDEEIHMVTPERELRNRTIHKSDRGLQIEDRSTSEEQDLPKNASSVEMVAKKGKQSPALTRLLNEYRRRRSTDSSNRSSSSDSDNSSMENAHGIHEQNMEDTVAKKDALAHNNAKRSISVERDEIWAIDAVIIEPYKKVLKVVQLTSEEILEVVCFYACYLPNRSSVNYENIMQNIFRYMMSMLDLLAEKPTVFLFFNGAIPKGSFPRSAWLNQCCRMIDRRMQRNLREMIIVHPNFWFKTQLQTVGRAMFSGNFYRKIRYANTLDELQTLLPVGENGNLSTLSIPSEIMDYDMSSPKRTSRRFSYEGLRRLSSSERGG